MRRITGTIILTALLAFAGAAQDSTSPPQSSDTGSPSTEASSPIGAGASAPSHGRGPVKVCRQGAPQPCATPPVVKKAPDPEYSKEAQKKRIEGTVVLWLIVGPDGLPHNIQVARSLGYGLDEEAIKAVKRWKFKPSTIDGQPVAVQINVQVAFRLYQKRN